MTLTASDWSRLKEFIEAFNKLGVAARELERALRPEVGEAESWPIYNSEYGDVMCGQDDCPCDAEDSVILIPFKDLTYPSFPPYTARELLDAIEVHIAHQRARQEEDQDV